MKVLVWHWGRRGAGPVFAVRLAEALAAEPGTTVMLSLARDAEVLQAGGMTCAWREPTYRSAAGYVLQRLGAVLFRREALLKLRALKPDVAVCAMPALLDRRMIWALRQMNIPFAMFVHDAEAHAGDRLSFRLLGQARAIRQAAALFPLSAHVAEALRERSRSAGCRITQLWLPPFSLGTLRPPFQHTGKPRLLCFGRLLPYKGLDLLADALTLLGPELPLEVKICGEGPVSSELNRLRALPGVDVSHRWIPEAELPQLIEWADAVVLPYREASQSGVAAVALAHGRRVVATRVGGLPEQLAGKPGAILCEPSATSIAEALRQIGTEPPQATANPDPLRAEWRGFADKLLAALREIVMTR